MKTVVTFGTFDLLHMGHLSLLQRASMLGDRLVVGVSSDALNLRKKGRLPVYSEQARLALVGSLKGVDEVFLEHALEYKADYLCQYHADILVMGDDWRGRFNRFRHLCEVIYLPRTPSVSTTAIIETVATRPDLVLR